MRLMNIVVTFVLIASVSLLAQAKNPIFHRADPHAVVIDGTPWIYPTFSERGRNFFAFKRTATMTWQKVGPIFDLRDVTWLQNRHYHSLEPWAPSIAQKDGRFYFYYSVGPQSENRPSHIGVAVATSPGGPFKDSGKPLVTGGNGFEAIDPMVFQDPASKKFYFYAGGSAGAKLRIFELADDMTHFHKEIPVETPKFFTEAPFIHLHDGLYHLTYSHGGWKDSSYSVHHATSGSPIGPWTYRGAILQSDETHKGPGHHSIIQVSDSNNYQIVYHRWNQQKGAGPFGGSRVVAIETLEHGRNGTINRIKMTD